MCVARDLPVIVIENGQRRIMSIAAAKGELDRLKRFISRMQIDDATLTPKNNTIVIGGNLTLLSNRRQSVVNA